MHGRDLIAAALLAGGDRDLLPVRVPRRSALALGTRHRGGGEHRLDLRHAELDRLAHREVHALAGGDPLHQHYAKRRLALDGAVREHIDQHLQPLDRRDARAVLAAAAVEERDLIAGLYAQHVHCVVRAVFRQQHAATGAQGGVEIKARHARIFPRSRPPSPPPCPTPAPPAPETLGRSSDRRMRPLSPPLAAGRGVVPGGGVAFLRPADLRRFGKFAAATSAFLTTVAAWSEPGYFAEAAPANPLLHLWS